MGMGDPAGGGSDGKLCNESGGPDSSDNTRSGGGAAAVSQTPTAAATSGLSTGESKQSLPWQQGLEDGLEGVPVPAGTMAA